MYIETVKKKYQYYSILIKVSLYVYVSERLFKIGLHSNKSKKILFFRKFIATVERTAAGVYILYSTFGITI